jgi:uncharacterized membrane protein
MIEVRKIPALLASAASFFIIISSIYYHKYSTLPQEYTWTRTTSLLWQSITDTHFITAAFYVLLAAHLLAPLPNTPAQTHKKATSAVLTLILVLIILLSNPRYSAVDYLLIPATALLMYKVLNTKNLLTASAGALCSIAALIMASYSFTIIKSQLFIHNPPSTTPLSSGKLSYLAQTLRHTR